MEDAGRVAAARFPYVRELFLVRARSSNATTGAPLSLPGAPPPDFGSARCISLSIAGSRIFCPPKSFTPETTEATTSKHHLEPLPPSPPTHRLVERQSCSDGLGIPHTQALRPGNSASTVGSHRRQHCCAASPWSERWGEEEEDRVGRGDRWRGGQHLRRMRPATVFSDYVLTLSRFLVHDSSHLILFRLKNPSPAPHTR